MLRTYQVAPEHQEEVYNALRRALEGGSSSDTPWGRVSRGPGGTLVVVAPDRLQAGIQGIVDADFEEEPRSEPTSFRPIRMTYSIVVGRPLESGTQPVTVRPRRIPRLDDVFSQIAMAQGPTEFAVLEELSVTSTNQTSSRVSGRFVGVDQTAARRDAQVVAEISLSLNTRTGSSSIITEVALRDGQTLVLGQAGFQGEVPQMAFNDPDNSDVTLYYIVTAEPS